MTTTTTARPTTSRSLTATAISTTNVSSASTTTSIRQYGTSRLKHVPIYLDSDLRKASFKQDLSKVLRALGFEGWSPLLLEIEKVSGSLTNAVFFVHHTLSSQTLLLRIYGPCTCSLISRKNELHMLHVLSTRYRIGPRVFGTFVNGRIEEYFDSTPLSPCEMRDPVISRRIGKRMRELHSVDSRGVFLPQENGDDILAEEVGVRQNVRKWIGVAKRVAETLKERDGERIKMIDLEKFEREWEEYWSWLMNWENKHGRSERVFAHNDTQYGNLLKLKNSKTLEIIVVDFEYASVNAAAFDIGNHFQEWMADYRSSTPHEMRQDKYPDKYERYNFYRGYGIEQEKLENMDESVKAWSRASEGMWAIWGVVQAESPTTQMPTERESGDGDFDYIGYALSRMLRFRFATY
ncbi:hypothetical protein Clacol_003685 [Clathrus columnatus]|uniref:Choline kinase n=1 Tax=Clathrus columnatus TaxID=1419009 RepID=A0AAV5A7I0_9AGAM|nr:hypothetical protein Clacol_003685 [Clathrus columnatus]